MPSYPIVAMHYYPPAKGIIAGLSSGTTLYLRAEPSNEHDINAIQVLLKPEDIDKNDYDNLDTELSGYGKEVIDILTTEEWHIGYIPREIAKILRESNIIPTDTEIRGEFIISFSGKPMININEI